jgi:hypothetical protein
MGHCFEKKEDRSRKFWNIVSKEKKIFLGSSGTSSNERIMKQPEIGNGAFQKTYIENQTQKQRTPSQTAAAH